MLPLIYNFSAESGLAIHLAFDFVVAETGDPIPFAGSVFALDIRDQDGVAAARFSTNPGGGMTLDLATGRVDWPCAAPATAGNYTYELIQIPTVGIPIPWVRGDINVKTSNTKRPEEN